MWEHDSSGPSSNGKGRNCFHNRIRTVKGTTCLLPVTDGRHRMDCPMIPSPLKSKLVILSGLLMRPEKHKQWSPQVGEAEGMVRPKFLKKFDRTQGTEQKLIPDHSTRNPVIDTNMALWKSELSLSTLVQFQRVPFTRLLGSAQKGMPKPITDGTFLFTREIGVFSNSLSLALWVRSSVNVVEFVKIDSIPSTKAMGLI